MQIRGVLSVFLIAALPAAWSVAGATPPASPELIEVEITEWPVPWERSRPRDPDLDGKGRVWFVGQRDHYLAYLEPATGEFRRYELEAGTGPHNLIVDEEGAVWFAGNLVAYIGRLDPATGEITKYPMPDSEARDPHTLVFDPQGDIWFTVQGGNFVGQLVRKTGEVRLVPVPTPRARPYGIVVSPEGWPWFTEFGSNRLATVDPKTLELREVVLPRSDARPRRLGITADGKVWYVDYAGGFLGRLDPETGEIREWPVPGGAGARPYGMAVDDRDRIWFVETGLEPNRLVGFDPGAERFFSITEIGSGGGAVRHMIFHRPSRTLWFGTDTNTIGRAQVP